MDSDDEVRLVDRMELDMAISVTDPVLTVIVPVYNEVETVNECLERVRAASADWQLIVVDDGSTDGTAKVLCEWRGVSSVKVIHHPRNRGKGAAIRTALPHADGRFTVIQDADLEVIPEDIQRLLAVLLAGDADAAYGSRYLNRVKGWSLRTPAELGIALLNLAIRLLYGQQLTDEAACHKMFATETLRRMELSCQGFDFCPEVTAKACRMGLVIREVPVRYLPRTRSKGKKLTYIEGLRAICSLWKWRNWNPTPACGAPEKECLDEIQ